MHHPTHTEPPAHTPPTLAPDATWRELEQGAALAWWQLTTFLTVDGPDAAEFLDAIVTQDMAGTAIGTARHALFLTNKARIVAPVLAYRASEERFLLELDPDLVDVLHAHLKRYRLRAKVALAHEELGAISLLGPRASELARGSDWFDSPAYGVPARTLVGPHDEAARQLDQLAGSGVPLADPEAVDAWRIAHSMPALSDLAIGSMPAEVGGMPIAVSLDKGCYLGQEPVARLHYRGHPNRTLRRVRLDRELPRDYFNGRQFDDDDYLALVRSDAERKIGSLTSWATAPDGSLVGLAIVRREVAAGERLSLIGTDVTVTTTDASD